MQLLDLPNEIIQNVLLQSIIARSVKRGVRLRLVCKQFNDLFTLALYQSHLLDEFPAAHVGFRWFSRDDRYGCVKLWHDYLVFRVNGEMNPDVGRYVDIRKTAETFHNLILGEGPSIQDIIHGLCWLAMAYGTDRPGNRELWNASVSDNWQLPALARHLPSPKPVITPSSPEHYSLCAAAYFNRISVASRLLQKDDKLDPSDVYSPFPSPINIAAFRGHAAIIDIFQRHMLSKNPVEFTDDQSHVVWAHTTIPDAIVGATANGDIQLLISVLFPPSVRPNQPHHSQRLDVDMRVDSLHSIWSKKRFSTTPAMYDYHYTNFIHPSLDERFGEYMFRNDQAWYAQQGNTKMLRHLVGSRPTVEAGHGRKGNQLYQACRMCFKDIVDFLLDRNFEKTRDVLMMAVKAGSVDIVRKLLEHGIEIPARGKSSSNLLRAVIRSENQAMLNLFLQKGFIVREENRQDVLADASAQGLDSMVEILKNMKPQG